MRPDIVWLSDDRKELWLLELTISYESLVADTRQRKEAKYYLLQAGRAGGYHSQLITVEVGSRGMLYRRWRFREAKNNTQSDGKRNEGTLSGSHPFHHSGVF